MMKSKYFSFTILVLAIVGVIFINGCVQQKPITEEIAPETSTSTPATLSNDFTPPTGKATGPSQGLGPWNLRLMSAISTDGLNFMRTNKVITDQGDVSDIVKDSRGWLYLYYTGWNVGKEQNKNVVAISQDSGNTWIYKKIKLSGFEKMAPPVDPDIQILADNTFRLYLTSSDSDNHQETKTYYAEGTDGINFIKKGVAFSKPGQRVLDPTVLKIGDTWHFFASIGEPGGENWYATSSDGKTFTFVAKKTFFFEGKSCVMANGLAVPGGYRFYDNCLRSFFSTDGLNWAPDPDARLTLDTSTGKEKNIIKEPTVVQLDNGNYFMVYSVGIP